MRKALFLVVTLVTLSASLSGQEILLDGVLPLKAGRVNYSGVIEVPGTARVDLYQRARRWVVMTYQSNKNIIQLDDFDNFELIGDGFYMDWWSSTVISNERVQVWQKIRIEAHRAKISYEITGFRLVYTITNSEDAHKAIVNSDIETWNQNRSGNRTKFFEQVDSRVKELIESLESALQN